MINEIKKDQIQARKQRNKFKTGILTALISEIIAIGKNKGNRKTTNSETVSVILKFQKNILENIKLAPNNKDFKLELDIYKHYLPKQLTESELKDIIINLSNIQLNIGFIMKELNNNFKGRFNGSLASKIIKGL